ncbi:MAG: OmpA family protein [Candidatus Competibacterales bacterium]|nr:OmpA family protein [Candidatus Competibacterales bacterium]
MFRSRWSLSLVLIAALAVTACAPNDPYMRTKTGAAIGAIAGGILGHQLDDDAGRYVGAAAGAALGGGIGYAMDRQAQQLQQLSMQNQQLQMEVQRMQDGSIRVNMPSEVLFDFDSAALKPQFMPTLNEIARILNQDPRSTVTVVGHTDSTGSDSYNMNLSQRRAQSVANYLSSHGVSPNRLYAQGMGESQPRASNDTPQGRAQNRRVELFIRPTG